MKKTEDFWQEVKDANGKELPCPEYKVDIDINKNYYQLHQDVFNLIDDLGDDIHLSSGIKYSYSEKLIQIDFLLHQMKHHYLELEYQNSAESTELKRLLESSRADIISRSSKYCYK